MTEFMTVSQLKKMANFSNVEINVKAEVKSKGDPRTVNAKRGGTVDVCDAIISDGETEEQMKLTLWGDDIKAVNVGDTVAVTNGYVKFYRGELVLTKGNSGTMEVNPT